MQTALIVLVPSRPREGSAAVGEGGLVGTPFWATMATRCREFFKGGVRRFVVVVVVVVIFFSSLLVLELESDKDEEEEDEPVMEDQSEDDLLSWRAGTE